MKILLIRRGMPIPEDYTPQLFEVSNGLFMDRCAAICMRRMLYAANSCGIKLHIISAYRSPQRQKELVDEDIRINMLKGMSRESATAYTLRTLAKPNESEHNAGLAADISGADCRFDLSQEFENTPEFRWLMANAYRFGYILRYPKDKTHITGIDFEPWHFRYVGAPHSENITRRKISLEEYLSYCPE